MDSFDSAGLPTSGSRLLSQSPQFSFTSPGSNSNTGLGGTDLSLSELYPDDYRLPERDRERQTRHNPKTRPSIAEALGFGAPPPSDQSDDILDALEEGEEEEEEVGTEADETVRGNDRDVEDADRTSVAAQLREEKLQNDLFVLRQLNGAFAVYNDALREAQAGTEVNWSFQLQTCPNLLYVTFLPPPPPVPSSVKSTSPNSSSRRTRCLTSTSTSYPRPIR